MQMEMPAVFQISRICRLWQVGANLFAPPEPVPALALEAA